MLTKSVNLLPRAIIKKLHPFLKKREIIVILGARQVGKTSLLRYFESILKKERPTFYLDLEDIDLRKAIKSAHDLLEILTALGYKPESKAYLFLDEAHYLHDATSILKFLYDHHPELKLIITGSSSLKLKISTIEPLTGRKFIFHLFPLSFSEFLNFTGRNNLKEMLERTEGKRIPHPFKKMFDHAFEEYIVWGGYPKVALTASNEMRMHIIKEIQSTYLEREIVGLVREEQVPRFQEFVTFLAAQNGGLVKVLEISKELGLARQTVQRYIKILRETFVADLISPIGRSKQKEITKTHKLYFLDTGFLNFTLKDFRPLHLRRDSGLLLETVAFSTLLRKLGILDELFYWRSKRGKEVDFILRKGHQLCPIEVKENPGKAYSQLKKFAHEYNTKKSWIWTKDIWEKEIKNDVEIVTKPIWAVKEIP